MEMRREYRKKVLQRGTGAQWQARGHGHVIYRTNQNER